MTTIQDELAWMASGLVEVWSPAVEPQKRENIGIKAMRPEEEDSPLVFAALLGPPKTASYAG